MSWKGRPTGALVQGTVGCGTVAAFLGWLGGEVVVFYILFTCLSGRIPSGGLPNWLAVLFVLSVGGGWTVGGVMYFRSTIAQFFSSRLSRLLLSESQLVYQPGRDDSPDYGKKRISAADVRRVVPETQSGTLYLRVAASEGGFALAAGLEASDRDWLLSVLNQWLERSRTTGKGKAAHMEKGRRDLAARSSLQRILRSPIELLEEADIQIADQGRGVLLSWRRALSKEPGRVSKGLFMLFWLCAWAVGEVLVVLFTLALLIAVIFGINPPPGMGWKESPLVVVFLALWTYIGMRAFREMNALIGLRRPSRLWLTRDELVYKGGSGEFGWFRRRRSTRVELRKVALVLRRGRRQLVAYTGQGSFEIGRNLRFGQREWLYKVLHQWLEG